MKARNVLVGLLVVAGMVVLGGNTAAQTADFIYCRVSVSNSMGILAVDLPGNPVWDLEDVPQGGVKDTWYDESGKASYLLKNSGDTPADIYIAAEANDDDGPFSGMGYNAVSVTNQFPTRNAYALAFATNVMDILPSWQMVNIPLAWSPWMSSEMIQACAMMSRTRPGENVVFDLKFYAPTEGSGDMMFRVGFYAVPVGGDPAVEIPDPPDPYQF